MRGRARTARAAMAAALFMLTASAASAANDDRPLSGRQLLQLCEGIEAAKPVAGTPADSRCLGYVQGVVDALDTLKARRTLTCPPLTLTVKEIIHFYQSEAQLFPDALSISLLNLLFKRENYSPFHVALWAVRLEARECLWVICVIKEVASLFSKSGRYIIVWAPVQQRPSVRVNGWMVNYRRRHIGHVHGANSLIFSTRQDNQEALHVGITSLLGS